MLKMDSPEVKMWQQKLNTLEWVVTRLLSKKQPFPLVKEKLGQMEEAIIYLINEDPTIAQEWMEKFTVWSAEYEAIVSGSKSNNSEVASMDDIQMSSDVQQQQEQCQNEPIVSSAVNNQNHSSPPPHEGQPKPVQTIPSIFDQMTEHFDSAVIPENLTYFERVKLLARVLLQALYLVPPNNPDRNLQQHVFQLAFGKLFGDLPTTFKLQYTESQHSLYTVFRFIFLELEEFVENFKCNQAKLQQEFSAKSNNQSAGGPQCFYCKDYIGPHETSDCPLIICFNCFETDGHFWRHCTNEPYYRRLNM